MHFGFFYCFLQVRQESFTFFLVLFLIIYLFLICLSLNIRTIPAMEVLEMRVEWKMRIEITFKSQSERRERSLISLKASLQFTSYHKLCCVCTFLPASISISHIDTCCCFKFSVFLLTWSPCLFSQASFKNVLFFLIFFP